MTTTDTTPAPKYRTITLTGRAPIRIREDEWPAIARGFWYDHDNQYEFQANRTWSLTILVRCRTDAGLTVVYGVYDYDTHFQGEPCFNAKVGILADAGEDVAKLIERVGNLLRERLDDADEPADAGRKHIAEVVAECIGNLPAEDM